MELQKCRSVELTCEPLIGAVDVHVHPDPYLKSSPRRVDPIYYVEKEYASIDEGMEDTPNIKEAAEHCILYTDFRRYTLSTAVEGLRQFITCMLDMGISANDIRPMVKTNPEWLLGLEPLEGDHGYAGA